jgi:cytochrome c-type biogenesis protein
MEWINESAQNQEMPLLAALGLLTAIARCPFATNITATAFIAKTINGKKKVLLSGLLYTLGRMFSYTVIGTIIYFGASTFQIAKLFQGNGEKNIDFVLVILGMIMLGIIIYADLPCVTIVNVQAFFLIYLCFQINEINNMKSPLIKSLRKQNTDE